MGKEMSIGWPSEIEYQDRVTLTHGNFEFAELSFGKRTKSDDQQDVLIYRDKGVFRHHVMDVSKCRELSKTIMEYIDAIAANREVDNSKYGGKIRKFVENISRAVIRVLLPYYKFDFYRSYLLKDSAGEEFAKLALVSENGEVGPKRIAVFYLKDESTGADMLSLDSAQELIEFIDKCMGG